MAAFTAVATGFTPQTHMTEIISAVNERRLAAIASGATGLPAAISEASGSFQGGTVKPAHLLIQEMLEALAPKFADHTQYGYDNANATVPIAPFTLTTWRAEAGLNSSGFRRATAWADSTVNPSFSYGLIQSHDLAGYWIWVDIVKGLQALRWTVANPALRIDAQSRLVESDGDSTVAAARDAVDALWAASSWGTLGGSFTFHRANRLNITDTGGGNYVGQVQVYRGKASRAFGVTIPFTFTAVFLAYPVSGGDGYYDIEGLPENEWTLRETVNAAADSTSATMTVYPLTSPSATPASDSGIGANETLRSDSTMRVVLKWDFNRE